MRGRQNWLALLEPGLTKGYLFCNADAAVPLRGVHTVELFVAACTAPPPAACSMPCCSLLHPLCLIVKL